MPKYGIATLLEAQPVGYEFRANNTPLHLTHVDSCIVDLSPEQLAEKLRERLKGLSGFSVTALDDEMLGPNKDIPVTVLDLTQQLKELHALIMQTLEREKAVLKNPHFHNEGFHPHVSIYGSRRTHVGEQVSIENISIGTKLTEEDNPLHRIVATIPLG